jgi:glycosyltransferase involved in cell wall biosynthesis
MRSRIGISVVIPAFNSAATIARALDSVLIQTYSPAEILVVDDCSSDATRSIVEGYADRGVTLVALPQRRGAAGARNAGIAAASGDAIAFLDSDDEWLNPKLEMQVAVLTSSAQMAFVACASNLISPEGIDLGDIYRGHPIVTGAESWKALLEFNFITTPAVLAWRERILAAGGFDEKLKIGEDQDLWIRLSLAGELGYVRRSLVRVHSRHDSLSAEVRSDPMTYTLPMIERHVVAMRAKLSAEEVRHIMGKRLGLVGRVAYAHGDYRNGLRLIGRSILLGYQPVGSLYYMASASPPAIWLKHHLGIGRPW